jgi:hypothetical protein
MAKAAYRSELGESRGLVESLSKARSSSWEESIILASEKVLQKGLGLYV